MSTVFEIYRMLSKQDGKIKNYKNILSKFLRLLIMLAVMAVSTVVVFFIFFYIRTTLIIDQNLLAVLLMGVLLLSIVIGVNIIIKIIYNSKNNELLFSLPCTGSDIFWAKLLLIFVNEYITNLMMAVPVFITYGILSLTSIGATAVSVWFYILIPVFVLFLTVLSLIMSGFLSVPVMAIGNYLNKKPKTKIITYSVLIALLVVGYLAMISNMADNINFSQIHITLGIEAYSIILNIAQNTKLFLYMTDIMLFVDGFGRSLLYFTMFMAFAGALSIFLIQKYFYFLSARADKSSKTIEIKYNKRDVDNPFVSMYKKEQKDMFRSSNYILQFFIFTFCMPFVVLVYDKLLLNMEVNSYGVLLGFASHIFVFTLFACLSNLAIATTMSREGNCNYWGKIAPINYKDILTSKIILSYGYTMLAIVITTIVVQVVIDIDLVFNLVSSAVVIVLSFAHCLFSFIFDLKKPVLDWVDEDEIVKKSKATFYSLILGVFLGVLSFVVFTLFSNNNPYFWGFLILFTIGIGMIITAVLLLVYKAEKYLQRMGE